MAEGGIPNSEQPKMITPQEVWDSFKDLLKNSYVAKGKVDKDSSSDEWGNLWSNEGRFVVQYREQTKDGFKEKEHIEKERDKIVSLCQSFSEKISEISSDDDLVYKTKNKPDTFLVISNFIAKNNESDYCDKNRIVCQITLDEQGKIKEMVAYVDLIKRQDLLNKLGAIRNDCIEVIRKSPWSAINLIFQFLVVIGAFIAFALSMREKEYNRFSEIKPIFEIVPVKDSKDPNIFGIKNHGGLVVFLGGEIFNGGKIDLPLNNEPLKK